MSNRSHNAAGHAPERAESALRRATILCTCARLARGDDAIRIMSMAARHVDLAAALLRGAS